jgi:hypothetical protein
MSEEVVEIPQESAETHPEEAIVEPPAASEAPAPEAKKRGRPHGAKDAVKRTRKPAVKLRVELVVREPPATNAVPKEPVAPAPQAPSQFERIAPEALETKSPRTLFRIHHEAAARERRQKKQEWAQMYTANWTA